MKAKPNVDVDTLRLQLPSLAGGDLSFASSLIGNYDKYGNLSDKQLYWVKKMSERAMGFDKKPEPVTEQVGSFKGVMALFLKAKEHLKYPAINLQVNDQPIRLYLSGSGSKYPNQVQVTDGGGFHSGTWFGRVDADGVWTQSLKIVDEMNKPVRRLLKEFGEKPAEVAKKYGMLTGRCCFCNSKLTDEKSTAAGFGPVCAKHYGLEVEWKKAVSVLETT